MSLIRATALSHFPELVRELGGDPGGLLATHGIRAADAGRSDVYVGLRGGISAIEAAATATGTMDFGRRLGLRQGIEILGPLGVAARTAETLGAALRIFDLFMAAYSPGLSVRLHPHADPTLMFFEYRGRAGAGAATGADRGTVTRHYAAGAAVPARPAARNCPG